MSSVDQSDYLDKFLICDSDGRVIIGNANDTKSWSQRSKLIGNPFAVAIQRFILTLFSFLYN
jgi:hypothetical protein